MTPDERDRLGIVAQSMWGGFFRCPTTGRVIEALHGDDKVLCPCGVSNPRVPTEQTHLTGVHIVRFLTEATVDEYLDQREADER
jgi:hypothetical protein